MDRDYGIGRLSFEEFYGGKLSNDSVIKTLSALRISLYDSDGQFRKTSELLEELMKVRRATTSFRNTRRINDVIDALVYAEDIKHNFISEEDECSVELDMFLGTFKVIQGGVQCG